MNIEINKINEIKKQAFEQTNKDTFQAMEALIANLNSLFSRSGNQLPFSSLNYGLDTSVEGRMIINNLLDAIDDGLGDGSTAIFPISIFKMMKGINVNPEDPNYDLWKKACKVCAKRFYPNFVSVDSSFNKQYVKYDEVESNEKSYLVKNKITNEDMILSEEEIKKLENKQQYSVKFNNEFFDIDE